MLAVLRQIYLGTDKYLSSPVANVVYTVETELPMLTVCPEHRSETRFGPMSVKPEQLIRGQFYPDNKGRFIKIKDQDSRKDKKA